MKRILIDESCTFPGLDILTRFRSFIDLRVGFHTILERLRFRNPDARFYYKNEDENFRHYFLLNHPEILPFNNETMDIQISLETFKPWDLLRDLPLYIEEDLSMSKSIAKWRNKFKPKLRRFEIVGKEKYLYIHPRAVIYPGVVIDMSSGPVVIDSEAIVTSFSFLEGPLYIGSNSRIDNARITGGSVIGKHCRIGGEVENSLVQDYSNKHHEGFLGHSLVGSWVNLGALSTTSDLKNNYGIVEIQSGSHRINTGTIKFGSIIGDFSKIGIGVMMNTGTTIDVGCNLVGSRIHGYIEPFTWLQAGNRYKLDRFIQDSRRIMARRSVELSRDLEQLISAFYNSMNLSEQRNG